MPESADVWNTLETSLHSFIYGEQSIQKQHCRVVATEYWLSDSVGIHHVGRCNFSPSCPAEPLTLFSESRVARCRPPALPRPASAADDDAARHIYTFHPRRRTRITALDHPLTQPSAAAHVGVSWDRWPFQLTVMPAAEAFGAAVSVIHLVHLD